MLQNEIEIDGFLPVDGRIPQRRQVGRNATVHFNFRLVWRRKERRKRKWKRKRKRKYEQSCKKTVRNNWFTTDAYTPLNSKVFTVCTADEIKRKAACSLDMRNASKLIETGFDQLLLTGKPSVHHSATAVGVSSKRLNSCLREDIT